MNAELRIIVMRSCASYTCDAQLRITLGGECKSFIRGYIYAQLRIDGLR